MGVTTKCRHCQTPLAIEGELAKEPGEVGISPRDVLPFLKALLDIASGHLKAEDLVAAVHAVSVAAGFCRTTMPAVVYHGCSDSEVWDERDEDAS